MPDYTMAHGNSDVLMRLCFPVQELLTKNQLRGPENNTDIIHVCEYFNFFVSAFSYLSNLEMQHSL